MRITTIISTDEGNLTLKRSFSVTPETRDECIQAAATLLNVSMSVVEEIEGKETIHTEKGNILSYKFVEGTHV